MGRGWGTNPTEGTKRNGAVQANDDDKKTAPVLAGYKVAHGFAGNSGFRIIPHACQVGWHQLCNVAIRPAQFGSSTTLWQERKPLPSAAYGS